MPVSAFFPSREERTPLDFVLHDFPCPMALTCARLQDELDRQEPRAAAWLIPLRKKCIKRGATEE